MEKKITFEAAIKELEEIVKTLENGDEAIDRSIALYERGVSLTKYCMDILEKAEQKVSVLVQKEGGKLALEPFDVGGEDE